MAKSAQLRANKKQHVPKNTLSKGDDKNVAEAMGRVIKYLNERFDLVGLGYKLSYVDRIRLSELIDLIRSYDKRAEFTKLTKEDSFIKPDGGLLILFKKQGREVQEDRAGGGDEASGHERSSRKRGEEEAVSGKRYRAPREKPDRDTSALQYEKVTPFVCFGWGVDFDPESSILDRIITMNEFYSLNKTYVFKRENYAPVSMYFRVKPWNVDELFDVMKEIAETSIRSYIH